MMVLLDHETLVLTGPMRKKLSLSTFMRPEACSSLMPIISARTLLCSSRISLQRLIMSILLADPSPDSFATIP
ncbi:mTERF [Musa troglodytarum]|uniref:mTERF n=1 Tax=Musa troglodytarum TaxID=320322 RepID=A0A9E7HS11_9LILI|nr:mTERF [Musa troglodytarum]